LEYFHYFVTIEYFQFRVRVFVCPFRMLLSIGSRRSLNFLSFCKGGKEQALILEYDGVEYHTKNPDIVTKHNFSQEYLDYDISRQIELESYGYRFLRLNKFNLRPEQAGETKTGVLDRFLRKAFAVE
jgi:hypothetical protein